jgi:hypothetical protein
MARFQIVIFVLTLSAAGVLASAADAPTPLTDVLILGDSQSERAHGLKTEFSQVIQGGLEQPARQLLPRAPVGDYGGSVSFTIRCDPRKPTYLTAKFWGGDAGEDRGRLLLLVDGKQLGVRHLGDIDDLDILADEPRYPGRFFYKTLPLPRETTRGRTQISLEIRALGRIWGYGATWEQFQKPMAKPSRGIYRLYTHTDPYFVPPAEEAQGPAVAQPPVRPQPGPEALAQLKDRVNRELTRCLSDTKPLNQMQMQFLARAYGVKWTVAYQSPRALQRLVDSLDSIYLAYVASPRLAQSDPATWNADWFGLGPSGDVIRLLAGPLAVVFDQPVAGGDGITRRAAWTRMLIDCRNWHRRHRRLYSNQSMINDMYGIYLANRGIAVMNPAQAMPEEQIRHYLYQSVGLEPWLGSDSDSGSEKPVGDHYLELTNKGLTRELGYVGAYGEVLDWVTLLYNATRSPPDAEGDPRIKAQLIKIAQARAAFRYPLIDAQGYRAMALETVVGWRDVHYPGDITYGQRTTWDAGPLETAAATRDPTLVGYAQEMLDDNQFFSAMSERMKDNGFRVTAGLLDTPDQYEWLKSQSPANVRLPMARGQPDFVFANEEDGVVAIKHGDEILYVSLYWRARYAINFLARVHYLTPAVERDATLWEDTKFQDSGMTYTVGARLVEDQSTRHDRNITDLRQALQGEVLPIARIPAGVQFKPGDESVYAGKGSFYTCRYGDFLIGMNMTTDQTFMLDAPDGIASAPELVSGKTISFGSGVKVPPRSTVVFYLR